MDLQQAIEHRLRAQRAARQSEPEPASDPEATPDPDARQHPKSINFTEAIAAKMQAQHESKETKQ